MVAVMLPTAPLVIVNVPAVENVMLPDAPGSMAPESTEPLVAKMECGIWSLFWNTTVSPATMLKLSTLNWKFANSTWKSVFEGARHMPSPQPPASGQTPQSLAQLPQSSPASH